MNILFQDKFELKTNFRSVIEEQDREKNLQVSWELLLR